MEFDDLRLSGDDGAPDVNREPPPETVNSACLLQQRLCLSNGETTYKYTKFEVILYR